MAHPAILRNLVEQFQTLRLLHAEKGTPESRRRLEDVTYTLCVSTGTRTPEEALTRAHEQLARALTATVEPGAVTPAPAVGARSARTAADRAPLEPA
ncbi:DUF5133 domain-containing protein [Streptomyces sp. NBC_01497]|uniref:DUF5133 domain-containing protein n=1 Tax=Streptomyces sp. NBC_01497 TaxID=2903885 RepID=UPI003FCCA93F